MFYDRKIKYLDYYENGERIRGGGYVKLQVRNGCLQIDLAVTGLYPTDAFDREVMLCGDKKESSVGKILICDGKGTFRHMCHDVDNIGNTGISYDELYGIRIPLATGREISCTWRDKKAVGWEGGKEASAPEKMEERAKAEKTRKENTKERGREEKAREGRTREERAEEGRTREERAEEGRAREERAEEGRIREERAKEGRTREERAEEGRTREESTREKRGKTREEDIQERKEPEERAVKGKEQEEKYPTISESITENRESRSRSGREQVQDESRGAAGGEREKPVQLMEDKWQQLYAIYPHIRPFDDEREYISIRPADFVLFPAESYRMANNSFLLHGYYNYKHLLLARVERKGEVHYYIGVPGNFYEKEKQVAIMFGFESFECAEEPAQAGDFGYYMMRTEL